MSLQRHGQQLAAAATDNPLVTPEARRSGDQTQICKPFCQKCWVNSDQRPEAFAA